MYTQCPNCRATFRIDVRKLRTSRGRVACRHCQTLFNALDALAESPKDFPEAAPPRRSEAGQGGVPEIQEPNGDVGPLRASRDDRPPFRAGSSPMSGRHAGGDGDDAPQAPPQGSGLGWWLGALAMAALLGWQVNVFEGARLAQNERVRPWLELACESLGCELTPYRDPRQIQVVDRALLPAPGGIDGYEFRLIISNQSSLAQAFPSIRLVLSELGGRASASRTFAPDEYLEAPRPGRMPVGKPFEIRLLIAKPGSEVGGFSFELI